MKYDLLSVIEKRMPDFSKGQRAIASYILTHYDKAAFMTASKLGKTVGISESTVVRFASEIGFEGYPELQKSLQQLISNKLTSVQRIEVTSDILGNGDVLDKVLSADIDKIRHTLDNISREDFDGAVNAILEAKNIYVVGEGEIFVMGDNRLNSLDSRELGCVDSRLVLGKVVLRFMPFDKFGTVQ